MAALDPHADMVEALETAGYMVISKGGPTPEQERELVPLLVGHGHLTCTECGTVYDPAKAVRKGKGKRSLEDMIASLNGKPAAQAAYALERIAAIEDQIGAVLWHCGSGARQLVFKERPELRRFRAAGGKG